VISLSNKDADLSADVRQAVSTNNCKFEDTYDEKTTVTKVTVAMSIERIIAREQRDLDP
jgi:hypothetical protein